MKDLVDTAIQGRQISDLSLSDVSSAIGQGILGPVEVTQATLERIEQLNPVLKAYVTVTADHAMARAHEAEAEIRSGLRRGPLHGVPIAVKDLCETRFAPTTAGMGIYKNNDTGRDSTVVTRLEQAGAVILGKLAMTEGAYSGHHPDLPTPLNPWGKEFWAGSSSSGSGVATATGMAFATLGSDTGGSIRFPSNACGITGLKGTWGRVSRHGVYALADSLDHVGPMARTAADCAAMMSVIAGADPADPTTLNAPVPDYLDGIDSPIRGLRIGADAAMILEATAPDTAAMIASVIETYTSLGAVIVPINLPNDPDISKYWTSLCGIEVILAHKGTWPERKAEYGPYLGEALALGAGLSANDVGEALQWRLVYNGALARAMEPVDIVLLPVTEAPTPVLDNTLGAPGQPDNPELGDLLKLTAPADLAGLPSLTLPGGFDARGAPFGFQLMGKSLSEGLLLNAGHAFQKVTDFHARRPDLSSFI
ncbi:amidase [Rhodalgimonas zhirmunskyi]|uniref:Amidase n=1 Tax=Rhodalgimonas zhirmunskyi TaxID=2964767 RepID=A0AAJ1U9E0_9RHOB|nr:amidase [Rhodoalgimonas zhirmunskyi]MDQ2093583.1 amidase [Rhodoalgimonas zhirmunskyi]